MAALPGWEDYDIPPSKYVPKDGAGDIPARYGWLGGMTTLVAGAYRVLLPKLPTRLSDESLDE